ncbi:MAG: hypothetical protein IPP63_19600 [Chloracidobacterium sp.]|nr:hypothetical protein [Chloracidobacterium sp.]
MAGDQIPLTARIFGSCRCFLTRSAGPTLQARSASR